MKYVARAVRRPPLCAPIQADLYKESKTFRGRIWSTRYFLLSGQWLFYYKSQSSYSKGDPPHKALDVADTWIMEKGIVRSGNKVRAPHHLQHRAPFFRSGYLQCVQCDLSGVC